MENKVSTEDILNKGEPCKAITVLLEAKTDLLDNTIEPISNVKHTESILEDHEAQSSNALAALLVTSH